MAGSPNLGIKHVATAQKQKEPTMNEAIDFLDGSVNTQTSFATADADVTLTLAQMQSTGHFRFTGALTADRTIEVPGMSKRMVVWNDTTGGFNLTVTHGTSPGSTGVNLAPDERALVHADAASVWKVATNLFSMSGMIEIPADKDYVLEQSAPKRYRLLSLIGQLGSGEMLITVSIGGTNVAGLTSVGFDSAESSYAPTSLYFVEIGDRVVLSPLNASGSPTPLDFGFTFKCADGWDQ